MGLPSKFFTKKIGIHFNAYGRKEQYLYGYSISALLALAG